MLEGRVVRDALGVVLSMVWWGVVIFVGIPWLVIEVVNAKRRQK